MSGFDKFNLVVNIWFWLHVAACFGGALWGMAVIMADICRGERGNG